MFALSRLRRFALFAMLVSIAALIGFLSSQHRLRLVVTPFLHADESALDWNIASLSIPPRRFESLPVRPTVFSDVITSLTQFENEHPTPYLSAVAVLDDPDSCLHLLEHSASLHCYNVDIGLHEFLARQGVYSRMWDLNGSKGLGGNGHNLLEIHEPSGNRWKVVDPYYHCYFTARTDSTPLSFSEFRELLIEEPTAILVHWYCAPVYARTEAAIMKELRFLAPFSSVHANNDYRWRYDHRYAWLMPLAPLFDKMPLRMSRALRTVLMGDDDARYILEDRHTPHYPFLLSHALFWTLLAAFGLSVVLYVTTQVRMRALRRPAMQQKKSAWGIVA